MQVPDVSHKICGNDTNLPSNITLVKSNLQKTCSKLQNPKSNNVRPMSFPKHHRRRTPDAETGENRPLPRQLPRGVEHGVIVKCRDPTFLTRFAAMTQIYHRTLRLSKVTYKKLAASYKIQNQTMFDPCVFPNITGAERQMQRQERTGHFHVNSEEEWNMFYDGVIVKCRDPTFLTRFAAMTQIYHRTLR